MKALTPLLRVAASLLFLSLGYPALVAQTYTDDFTNPARWGAPLASSSATTMSLASGRMHYVSTSVGDEGAGLPWNGPTLPLDRSWSAKVDMHISSFALTTDGQFVDLFLGVGKTGDWMNNHVLWGYEHGYWGGPGGGYSLDENVRINGADMPSLITYAQYLLTPPDVALRVDYNAAARSITYSFDANGATDGYNWVPQGTANLATGTYNLGLTSSDTLTLILIGSSEFQTAAAGSAYLSNLEVNIDPPTGANPILIADYYYPVQQGATWLYLGPAGVGSSSNTSHTRVRMADSALNLTLYNPAAFSKPVLNLDSDFGYFSGSTFVSTDNWQEYVSVGDGFAYHGMDDVPSEQMRIFMQPFPKDWTIGLSVSREIYNYSPAGVFNGGSSFGLTLMERTSVTVPAGTFPDCIRLRFTLPNGAAPQVQDQWWALGVGMIKKSRVSGYSAEENNGGFTQELVSCTSPTISPVLKSATNEVQTYPITVTTPGAWTASETTDWISVSPATGTGNGTVHVTLSANLATSARQGLITIAGASHVVTQAAGVQAAPIITTQPVSQTIAGDSPVTFAVVTSGYPAPTYQWRKNGVAIDGATDSAYTIPSVVAGDAANYTVVATNSIGSVTSDVAVLATFVAAPSYAVITITVE